MSINYFLQNFKEKFTLTPNSHIGGGEALDSYPTFKIQSVGIYRIQIDNFSDQRPLRTLLIKCLKLISFRLRPRISFLSLVTWV